MLSSRSFKLIAGLTITVALPAFPVLLSPPLQAAEPYTLHFAHIGAPGSLYDLSGEEFAKRVTDLSEGAIVVKLHPNSELGSSTDALKLMLTGGVDISLISTPMSSVAPEFGVFEMPFLIRSRAHVKRFREKAVQTYLRPAAGAKGYELLAMWELGFRHLINNKRAIENPETLIGLRLRVPVGEWRIKMFRAYGVEPIPMEFKDVAQAIQAGTIDGLETPLDLIYGAGLHKLQTYLTLSYHMYSPSFLIMSREKYMALPVPFRAIVQRAADGMQDWVLQRGEDLDAELTGKLKPYLSINEIDRIAFTVQSLRIYREYVQSEPSARALVKLIFESDLSPLTPAIGQPSGK